MISRDINSIRHYMYMRIRIVYILNIYWFMSIWTYGAEKHLGGRI